jgi:hypothetical protein
MNLNDDVGKYLKGNQNAGRTKYSILLFCLILFLWSIYYINPNNYVTQFAGPYFIISILLCVFGLLYLMTLTSLPATSVAGAFSFIDAFKLQPVKLIIGIILLALIIVITIVGVYKFPGGISNSSPSTKTTLIVLSSLTFISLIMLVVPYIYKNAPMPATPSASPLTAYSGTFKNILLIIFGLTFSGLFIYWLTGIVNYFSQTSSTFSLLINIFIILAVLGLTYKIVSNTKIYENSPLLQLIVNIILYIPCIFVSLVDKISELVGLTKNLSLPKTGLSKTATGKTATVSASSSTNFIYLGLILLGIILYLIYPYLEEKTTNQGGMLLINQPIYLTELKNLASYQTLNKITEVNLSDSSNPMQFNYNYAISFWTFLDSTNAARVNQYVSILNYANKPNILFNPMDNTMLFTVNKTNSGEINNITMDGLKEQGVQILYEYKNVSLQRWNHIVIQYNGGTFDIFINGKLMKSIIGVVPYQSLDTLQVGSENGIQGGICNLNYFNTIVNISQIKNLYNFFKNKTPPTHSSSQDTIMNVLQQTPNIVSGKPVQIANVSTYTDTLRDKLDKLKRQEEEASKEAEDSLMNNKYKSNFLSWEWYFKNNKY